MSQFKQLFPASATSPAEKIPIKLKLKNYWDKDTIEDLTKLVTLFGVSLKHFHLCKVEDGCIAVTWLCSCTAVEQLKLTLSDSRTANGLQTMGVLQVFIEDKLVLDFSKPHTTAASGIMYIATCIHVHQCSTTSNTGNLHTDSAFLSTHLRLTKEFYFRTVVSSISNCRSAIGLTL